MTALLDDAHATGQRVLECELVFETPDQRLAAKFILERAGFTVLMFDFVSPEDPDCRWAKVQRTTDMPLDDFWSEVSDSLELLGEPACMLVQFGEAFPVPTAVQVLTAIGTGATTLEIGDALLIDYWTLAPVVKELERHRLIRRAPPRPGETLELILPNEMLQ